MNELARLSNRCEMGMEMPLAAGVWLVKQWPDVKKTLTTLSKEELINNSLSKTNVMKTLFNNVLVKIVL